MKKPPTNSTKKNCAAKINPNLTLSLHLLAFIYLYGLCHTYNKNFPHEGFEYSHRIERDTIRTDEYYALPRLFRSNKKL